MNVQNYYKLPLDLGAITLKKILPKCNQRESVAHHLHLILTTSFGELLSDVQYGSRLWDEDFDNVSYRNRQKENILKSISSTIIKYEKRIEKVKVEMSVAQEELMDRSADKRMRRKLDFVITAVLVATNEPIVYRDGFFVSPLAYN